MNVEIHNKNMQSKVLFEDFFDDNDIIGDLSNKTDEIKIEDNYQYNLELTLIIRFDSKPANSTINIKKYISTLDYILSDINNVDYKYINTTHLLSYNNEVVVDSDEIKVANAYEYEQIFINFKLCFNVLYKYSDFCKLISNIKQRIYKKIFFNNTEIADCYIKSRQTNTLLSFNRENEFVIEKLYKDAFNQDADDVYVDLLSQHYSNAVTDRVSIDRIGKRFENYSKFNDNCPFLIEVKNSYTPIDYNRDSYALFLDIKPKYDYIKDIDTNTLEYNLMNCLSRIETEIMVYIRLVIYVRSNGININKISIAPVAQRDYNNGAKVYCPKIRFSEKQLLTKDWHIRSIELATVSSCLMILCDEDGSFYKPLDSLLGNMEYPYLVLIKDVVGNDTKKWFDGQR